MSGDSDSPDRAAVATLREWVDEVADRFDAAWRRGPRPAIASFLGDEQGARRIALLAELVKIDLEYRWKAGERPDPDAYRAEFPDLAGPDGALADDLVAYARKLHQEFGSTADPAAAGTLPMAAPGTAPKLPRMLGRFQLLEVLGSGSFGAVYKARDPELDRLVAVKVPRAGCFASPEEEGRFLREARSAAQLRHPGIVPVHEIAREGELPYLVSEYVEGRTLAQLLAERPLGFREAAELTAQVADALDYAHRQGIVHRDVKPGNILMDGAGQPHLTDFGLARREEAGVPGTLDGQVLGTPAYMSPEQAAGEQVKVDGRSDVYSLGVVLYELLTGEVPYRGSIARVLYQVRYEEPRPPRQRNARIPRDLETICLKCLRREPGRRYATAGDLAADLRRYLQGEPVRARPVRPAERLVRWARRHKPLVAAVAAAALVAGLLGGVGAWWRGRQRAEVRHAVEAHLSEAVQLRGQARWAEARATLGRADALLGSGGPEDLRRRLDQAGRDLDVDLVARLDAIRRARATVVEGRLDAAGADRDYAAAFAGAGLGSAGDDAQVVADRVRDSAVRGRLVGALDDWAACSEDDARRGWLLEVARKADPDPWRDRARKLALGQDRSALERLAAEAAAAEQSPQLVCALAVQLQRAGGDAAALLRRAQPRHPEDFWLNFALGEALAESNPAEALGYYRAALALRPDTPYVHNCLGLVVSNQGRPEQAEAEYRKAIALDPRYAIARYNLGNALSRQGRTDEAKQEYRKAIALDPEDADLHVALGNVLRNEARLAEAEAEYRKAIALDTKEADPHYYLGLALSERGRFLEAQEEYQEAIALDPKDPFAHNALGNALYDTGRPEEAKAEYRKAIALDATYASPHYNLGRILSFDEGRLAGAEEAYRTATRLDPKFALAHHALGNALCRQGRLDEALKAYQQAAALGHQPAVEGVRQCERLLALDRRLPALLRGDDRPAGTAEQLDLGKLCYFRQRYAASARSYANAFAQEPTSGDDLKGLHRYFAACAAALAGCGRGADANELDDGTRTGLRQQALAWLKADLASRTAQLEGGSPEDRTGAQQNLRYWQHDRELAGVRDPAALAKLPEPERASWQKLWQEVEAMLARTAKEK